MTDRERKRRRQKTEKLVRFTAAFVLLGLILGGGYTYAKYFSEGARWGVAIASGVYFSANYAASSSDAGSEEYFESIVNSNYMGSNYGFTFDVRNYENNILFNESGVTIPYSLSFWLGETPESATYTVSWKAGETTRQQTIGVGEANKVTIADQTIAGGSASVIEYTINIGVADSGVVHTAVPIYVEVWTDEGAIINKTLRGKMVLNNTAVPVNYIESQEFVVSGEYTEDAAKFTQIQKLAMLTYEIRTVGEVAAGDVTEKLKLSWDPTLLEIDLFDEAFMAWQESNKDADGNVPQKPAVDTATNWYYITLEVMPYSAQTVSFFRGSDYASKITSMETLKGAILAEKYSATGEGTE